MQNTNFEMGYITSILATKIAEQLNQGYPTEDRVVIISPEGDVKTESGLYIPDSAEELPRKGTVVQIGHVTEPNYSFKTLCIGDLVTYGVYAGKELKLNISLEDFDLTKYKITVLSFNEIIYIEKQ